MGKTFKGGQAGYFNGDNARSAERAALDAGTTALFQSIDWSYLADSTDEEILDILSTDPSPGTSFAAEKIAARVEARHRGLIKE